MMAPMMEKAIGIKGFGTLLPTQLLSMVMVPALTATAISMPAPAIMTIVFQGILAMASFCGAKSRSRAMTAKMMATRPTSIFPAMYLMKGWDGIKILSKGKARTTIIMTIIKVKVVFCFPVNASGFLKTTPSPIFRLALTPNLKMVISSTEKTREKRKISISMAKVSRAAKFLLAS